MTDDNLTSLEDLERLRKDQRISEEDYQLLHKAMEERQASETHQGGARRLKKSRQDQVIGGVCAGFAEYFGYDPWLVRAISIVLLIFALPITLTIYLILYFRLPWDETMSESTRRRAKPWWFAGALTLLWLLNLICMIYVVPRFMVVYEQLGMKMPTLTQLVVSVSVAARVYGLWTFPLQMAGIALAAMLYSVISSKMVRLFYAWTCIFALLCLPGLTLLAVRLPLINLPPSP